MRTKTDTKSIDNIIKKLQVYMQRNSQSMHGLANLLGFAYQPFYRLMTKKNFPTISSLSSISKNLKCSIAELTGDEVFLDVPCYETLDNVILNDSSSMVRIYMPYELLKLIMHDQFFVVKTYLDKTLCNINGVEYDFNTNVYQIFSKVSKIDLDGFFLVRYKGETVVLEVINVSRTVIAAKYQNKSTAVPVGELSVFGKFVCFAELKQSDLNHVSLLKL